MPKKIKFEEITLRKQISDRGGGIEIDLTRKGFKGHKMSAYQNYLGGGMLGKICTDNTINAFNLPCSDKQQAKLNRIGEELKKYLHSLKENVQTTYEDNQKLPVSAY